MPMFKDKSGSGARSFVHSVRANYGKKPMLPPVAARMVKYAKETKMKRAAQKEKFRVKSDGIAIGAVMNEGSGGQYSMFFGKKGRSFLPGHVEDALAPQTYVSNVASQLKSSVGLQNISVPLELFPPFIASNYTGDKITRVIYEKANGDVTLNNIYLSNAYIIIYDCFARKDIGVTSIQTPLLAWSQGDTDMGLGGAPYEVLGSTPWQSELFNQYWKVEQVTNIVLAAGGTHVHKVRLHPKRVISGAYAEYTSEAFKDVTYMCMVEVHGSPANDTVTQTQVTIGSGGLNIIADTETTVKQLVKTTPTLTVGSTLLGAFTTAEQVVNMGGSTVTTNIEG